MIKKQLKVNKIIFFLFKFIYKIPFSKNQWAMLLWRPTLCTWSETKSENITNFFVKIVILLLAFIWIIVHWCLYVWVIPLSYLRWNRKIISMLLNFCRERLDALNCSDKTLDNATFSNPWPMTNREVVPTIMKLANMFYTTKHRWFPNKEMEKRRKRNPPQDRPID